MLPIHDRRVEKSVSNCRLVRVLGTLSLWLFATPAGAARELAPEAPGKPIVIEAPPDLPRSACSFRRAICVHGGDSAAALGVLDSLERAWETGLVLGVPLPRSYDAYIGTLPSRSATSDRDLLAHFDHARAFSIIDSRTSGCTRDFESARELYAASALGATPAIDDGSLRATSTALAHLAVPCAPSDEHAFQAHPDRALVDPDVAPSYDAGASAFFTYVDDDLAKEPGGAITSTWALAPTKTPRDDHWNGEPDVFDVLRESAKDAKGPGTTFDDLLVAFAIHRALDLELPVALDWDVGWPAVARTLSATTPIAPTGSSYVRIDTAARKTGSRLRIDATWEEHARIRWTVVKLDAARHELARWEAKAQPKATEAHLQIVDLDGAAALLVVAANVGPWTGQFDPDDAPWEPHGWLLTIAQE
jgi:hypothetical protein